MLLLKPEEEKKWFNIQRLQVGPAQSTSRHHALTWVNITCVNQLRQQYRVLLESIT